MARFSGIYRRALWLSCLFCALFLVATADAATRKFVKLPSKGSVAQNPSLPPSRTGDSIQITGQPLEGEFIPGDSGTKGVPIKVLPRLDGSLPRMFSYAKNGMRGGAIGIAGALTIGLMLDQIDAYLDENGVLVREKPADIPASGLYWCGNRTAVCTPTSTDYMLRSADTPLELANYAGSRVFDSRFEFSITSSSVVADSVLYNYSAKRISTGSISTGAFIFYRRGNCPQGATYSPDTFMCQSSQIQPLSDSDYDLMFDYANQQNADWLNGLLKDACNGSNNPAGCFNELLDQAPLGGPSSVNGPTTTKTTTTTGPNGVTSQTVTTTNTKYDITYGDNYYDYRKTETTETKKDGVTETETTETEPEEVEQEEKPQEEEEQKDEDPSPCAGTNCDGPAYEDQYEPTEEEKEDSIDDYMTRVQDIPILVALGGMFDISVAGSCPIWELHHAMPIMGTSMNIDLVFDFLCVSWFVSYGPWIRAVIYAVAAFAAVRVGLL
jgi:hypothetical protein